MAKKIKNQSRKRGDCIEGCKECSGQSGSQAAYYIADMLVSLRKIAHQEEMNFLVYLLDMACSEAVTQRDDLEKKQHVMNG